MMEGRHRLPMPPSLASYEQGGSSSDVTKSHHHVDVTPRRDVDQRARRPEAEGRKLNHKHCALWVG